MVMNKRTFNVSSDAHDCVCDPRVGNLASQTILFAKSFSRDVLRCVDGRRD